MSITNDIINPELADLVANISDTPSDMALDEPLDKPIKHKRLMASAYVVSDIVGSVAYTLNTPFRWTAKRYRQARLDVERLNARVTVQSCTSCSDYARKNFSFATKAELCDEHRPLYPYR